MPVWPPGECDFGIIVTHIWQVGLSDYWPQGFSSTKANFSAIEMRMIYVKIMII